MALATIAQAPSTPEEFFIWAQAHASHHYDCNRGIYTKYGKTLDQFILDPFDPEDMVSWLDQHQAMHQAVDTVLSIASYDLSELDWKDGDGVQTWFAQNYTEHQQWASILSIG